MAGSSEFHVTDWSALHRAVDPAVEHVANGITANAAARTPVETGRLRGGWKVGKTRDGGREVSNDVPYARFVEYGTKHNQARAMLGQATAQARATYGH